MKNNGNKNTLKVYMKQRTRCNIIANVYLKQRQ